MNVKSILLILTLLCGCTSKPKTAQPSPNQDFYNSHLLFDLAEETEHFDCPIEGKIPDWLSGTLLRNGPGKFTVGDKRVDWFDGLALLHAFTFTPEHVFYSSRFLRSEQYYIMLEEKSLNFSGFAIDPCPKVFKNQTTRFIPQEMKDINNADVSIQKYGDQFVALTEIPLPVIFDPETLATIGVFNYQDKLEQGQWESPHALVDPATGETFNYFIRFGRNSHYVIWKMTDPTRKVVAEIPVDQPAYMHSFALTERYVVLVEFPFVVNPRDLLHRKKPFIMNYKWKPERGTNFIVVERATGKVTKIKGKPFFAFHHINAFDKEGKIYLDIVTYPDAHIISEVDGDEGWKSDLADTITLKRFTLSLPDGLSEEELFVQSAELPRVSPQKVAHEYRFCYLVDYDFPNTVTDKRPLYKLDTTTKTAITWSEQGCIPGEPIFVERPGAVAEDDGVVLSLVLDFANHKSHLLILDAKDMKEIARAAVPQAVPLGLHGLWKGKQ
ncbi:MAG: carotenoid oxygenase family protein [Verrucomicrobia bacterium]|nr:carotenoid oxygenase family protein [Verrucomicrobiota bacterium]